MKDIDSYADWTATTMTPEVVANEGQYITAGFVGEVGELFSALAKFHRKDYSLMAVRSMIFKELGDIGWFWVRLCRYYGYDPSEVLQGNMEKLESRMLRNRIQGSGDDR